MLIIVIIIVGSKHVTRGVQGAMGFRKKLVCLCVLAVTALTLNGLVTIQGQDHHLE